MIKPLVISVILNTNRREDTLECLASLQASNYPNHKAIVLDNQSSDRSVDAIRSTFPQVQIIELKENLGYAGNNNVGVGEALLQGADWVFILNEDIILDPDCLPYLIEVGESDLGIGILGPMVYHYTEPNIIQSAGGRLGRFWEGGHYSQNEPDRGEYTESHKVDWIAGCGILLRRSVIEQIGMLDARFFYYWEETEWCLRASKAGWIIMQVPQAKLWHKGVQRDYHPKPSLFYYDARNKLLLYSIHHAPASVWIYNGAQILRRLISWTIKPKWQDKLAYRNAMWRGVVDFFFHRWGRGTVEK